MFGYRGVILFPWLARVFDRYDGRSNVPALLPAASPSNIPEIRAQSITYYQVLIDTRDIPYIRAQTGRWTPLFLSPRTALVVTEGKHSLAEAVTFLGNQERDRNLYAIPGLDYVAHEDVIPYTVRTSRSHQYVQQEVLAFSSRVRSERRSNMNCSINF